MFVKLLLLSHCLVLCASLATRSLGDMYQIEMLFTFNGFCDPSGLRTYWRRLFAFRQAPPDKSGRAPAARVLLNIYDQPVDKHWYWHAEVLERERVDAVYTQPRGWPKMGVSAEFLVRPSDPIYGPCCLCKVISRAMYIATDQPAPGFVEPAEAIAWESECDCRNEEFWLATCQTGKLARETPRGKFKCAFQAQDLGWRFLEAPNAPQRSIS